MPELILKIFAKTPWFKFKQIVQDKKLDRADGLDHLIDTLNEDADNLANTNRDEILALVDRVKGLYQAALEVEQPARDDFPY